MLKGQFSDAQDAKAYTPLLQDGTAAQSTNSLIASQGEEKQLRFVPTARFRSPRTR